MLACGDEENPPAPGTATISVTVLDVGTATGISGANVVLYNSATGDAVERASSAANGTCSLTVSFPSVASGSFGLRVSAQGYKPSPAETSLPVPFQVNAGETIVKTVQLTANGETAIGKITGQVTPAVGGMMVIATASNDASVGYQSVTGPDGYFAIFNVPYGTYTLKAVKKGYTSSNEPKATLSESSQSTTVNIAVAAVTGASMSGNLSINTTAGVVLPVFMDVTLLDPATMQAIPGLSVQALRTNNWAYLMTGIPPGTYKAWASFGNDNLVMDPDWVRKNPTALDLTVTNNQSIIKSFNTTPSFVTVSPSNPLTNLVPAVVTDTNFLFTWIRPSTASSADFLVIEVRNSDGNAIWGGFANNTLNPTNNLEINKSATTIAFNSDGKAIDTLKPGEVYQWKIYAVDLNGPGTADDVLLSVSEDQTGLFMLQQ